MNLLRAHQSVTRTAPAAGAGERGGRMRACLHRHGCALPWPRHRPQRPAPALCAVDVRHVAAQPDGACRPTGVLDPPAAGRALRSVQGARCRRSCTGTSITSSCCSSVSAKLDRDPRSGHRRAHRAARGSLEAFHRRRARAGAGGEASAPVHASAPMRLSSLWSQMTGFADRASLR